MTWRTLPVEPDAFFAVAGALAAAAFAGAAALTGAVFLAAGAFAAAAGALAGAAFFGVAAFAILSTLFVRFVSRDAEACLPRPRA